MTFQWVPLFLMTLLMTSMAHSAPNADGEEVPVTENSSIATVVEMIEKLVLKSAQSEGRAFRDAHRKHHGCVRAEFKVLENLPAVYTHGLFKAAANYEAIVRFSNGSGGDGSDYTPDGRGMAIKVLGVKGPKLLLDEAGAETQDFLMINHPVFFVRNAEDYIGFQQAAEQGGSGIAGWAARRAFHEGAIILATASKRISNPLSSRYWSMVPSKLGPSQMKFSAQPCAGSRFRDRSWSRNFLRENMTQHLSTQNACFDFMVQLRTRPDQMPVEDATIEWSEALAPFVPVARLTIATQAPETGESCETLSFTPWHALEDNRPLGGISRVRKDVYRAISVLRHHYNNQVRMEP